MNTEPNAQRAAPALHLPVMSAPVLRKQSPGGATPAGGVEAAGWLDTIRSVAYGVAPVARDVGSWLGG